MMRSRAIMHVISDFARFELSAVSLASPGRMKAGSVLQDACTSPTVTYPFRDKHYSALHATFR